MTQVLIDRATLEQLVDCPASDYERMYALKKQLRAALANAEPAGWQPIETAPKDGSFYLAFGEGKTWTQNQPNGCYPGEWHFSESRGEWRGHALTNDATHWMPLPHSPGDTL